YERECGGSEELRKCTLAGTVLLHSQSVVNFLKTLPGVKISEEVEARVKNAKDVEGEAVEIAREFVEEARNAGLGGVHLMPAGRSDLLEKVLR
ncbi:MAG: hypothetical protein ABIH99_02110, partial [Candidatus Micrarchaeota archaeon]